MNALPYVYECCMTNGFKEKWVWPVTEPDTGLYKDKYCNNITPVNFNSQEKEERYNDSRWWP